MRGYAEGHGVLAPGDAVRNPSRALDDEGKWSGPELIGHGSRPFGNVMAPLVEVVNRRQVNDQRMVGRTTLHLEHACDGGSIVDESSQAIDRLGRERHEPAC